jgi:hypothetical protein
MAGPGDQVADAGRGRLRASHADREQVIEVLKAAFADGRLGKDELDLLAAHVFTARTYAELAAVTADIPAGAAVARPPARERARERAREPAGKVKAIGYGACAVALLAVLGAVSAEPTHNAALFVLSFFTFIGATAVAWGAMIETRSRTRVRGPRPQGPVPGAGGQESWHAVLAAGTGQPPEDYPVPPRAAEAAPRLHPGPLPGSRTLHLWCCPGGRHRAAGQVGRWPDSLPQPASA